MSDATEPRQRSRVFGEVVQAYENARPDYPAALVTDVIAFAGPGPALEVGAGTGKATVAFAAHGIDITCVEPDPRMAEALSRNCAARVIVTPFESWQPDREFGLLYAAQSWHWVDPARRLDLAHAALAPGGALALFWNSFSTTDQPLLEALTAVDTRHGVPVGFTPHARRTEEVRAERTGAFDQEWQSLDLVDDSRFTDLEIRYYTGERTYTTADYVDLLASISHYRILDTEQLDGVLAEVARVIDARGGTIGLDITTDLALARRI
ncbi:SAM-dependent methyltransferase [Allocatelliglobosispora scoriae]|uniref:SAM-dependent methyltransferase n=1 Tax=Allocatelliglobosispora scoriae TaxID=643052 RepID=A0A841BP97_9ACTN|nr:class I SAM-dependent methyltransferase [Allocatelliglobosispora scoriae]MBB5868651.1 SAM-dependent methyltransferase [Allocatelliglobosispora scoriae]